MIHFFGIRKKPAKDISTVSSSLDDSSSFLYQMPSEEHPHEGTWLQWPHNQNGANRRRRLVERYEESWVQMTMALSTGERVHIIVYNVPEKDRIHRLLSDRGCDMEQIDFYTWPTDDVWIRDNGPIFVFTYPRQPPNQQQHEHQQHQLHITDWKFNGWGNKANYQHDNQIPSLVAHALGLPQTTIPMVNEGGSIEVDGCGTLMAKRSSILNNNRNKGWKQEDAEAYFRQYLGVSNFIWLDGTKGMDITDDHIDGTARFANGTTIITHHREDFEVRKEYDILERATNVKGESYQIVHLPLTKGKVVKGDYGIYINYYVANSVLLVPSYGDPNDVVAERVLQGVYPNKRIVSVNMKEVLKDGGAIHCVTQQQPMAHTYHEVETI